MFAPHYVSHVTCHISGITCYVSGVRCQYCFHSFFFLQKKCSQLVQGLLSMGPSPSSLIAFEEEKPKEYLQCINFLHVFPLPQLMATNFKHVVKKYHQFIFMTEMITFKKSTFSWKFCCTNFFFKQSALLPLNQIFLTVLCKI